jgi:hypothetical protein
LLEQHTVLFQQKKELKDRYDYLKDNVFSPLAINIVSTKEDYYYKIPKLIFDDLKVLCYDAYEEGLKHLKKDISRYSKRIDCIEKKVNEFNNNFEFFEKCELENMVIKYINNDFYITNNVQTIPASRNIIIDLLLPCLKALWFSNSSFDLSCKEDETELKIKGAVIAVFSNIEEKTKIENCINNLKKYDNIVNKIEYFKDKAKEILNEGQNLPNEIRRNIVTEIERKEYRTTCEDCPKLFNFSRRKKHSKSALTIYSLLVSFYHTFQLVFHRQGLHVVACSCGKFGSLLRLVYPLS